ncbi:MAG: glutamine amidotransferase [Gammaproteobacteria bacterium]|nr:glutamine amidotransferase [Gammaproteobacteria bacterium]
MSGRVLVVLHQEHSTPGFVGAALEARGYQLERCCPNLGGCLPTVLEDYAAAVVFGGPQSANDDHLPGIRAELDWLERHVLPAGMPLLGICLGAQEIARVLGARVHGHADGHVEIGYCEVLPAAAGADFLDQPTMFYQWHAETFEIPAGAVQLARGTLFEAQAYRYGTRVYGIEYHPEMTRAMIERWATSERGSVHIAAHRGPDCAVQLDQHARYAAASRRWLERFLDGFLPAAAD